MSDRLEVISFEGGLNETLPDIKTHPGSVRKSLNYAIRAHGGYEWIRGAVKWNGINTALRMEAIEFVKVNAISNTSLIHIHEASFGVKYKYIGSIDKDGGKIAIVEKIKASDDFPTGGALFNILETDVISGSAYSLLEADMDAISAVLSAYVPNTANFPGAGDIWLLESVNVVKDNITAVEIDGNTATLYTAGEGAAGWVGWIDSANTLTLPADKTGMRWEGYPYTFATTVGASGRNSVLFLVNNITEPYFVSIDDTSGMPNGVFTAIDDTVAANPTHVIVHQDHLFLSYKGGRILHSAPGDPTDFTVLSGAGEFSSGGEVTGFEILPGDSLGIFCEDRIRILSGTSSADWVLNDFTDEAGAIEGTIQSMPTTVFADKNGLATLSASDAYGNFTNNTLTQSLPRLFKKITEDTQLFSVVSRSKSQYRLFNENGKGIYLTFSSGALAGAMEIDLGMSITAVGALDTDTDAVMVASGGQVYQLDAGPDMAGTTVTAFIELVDHPYQYPRNKKRFSQVDVDAEGPFDLALNILNRIDGGKDFHADNSDEAMFILKRTPTGNGAYSIDSWMQRLEATAYIDGVGISQYLRFTHQGTLPHVLNAATVHYRPRGQKR